MADQEELLVQGDLEKLRDLDNRNLLMFPRRHGQSCIGRKNNPMYQGKLGLAQLSSDPKGRAWTLGGTAHEPVVHAPQEQGQLPRRLH